MAANSQPPVMVFPTFQTASELRSGLARRGALRNPQYAEGDARGTRYRFAVHRMKQEMCDRFAFYHAGTYRNYDPDARRHVTRRIRVDPNRLGDIPRLDARGQNPPNRTRGFYLPNFDQRPAQGIMDRAPRPPPADPRMPRIERTTLAFQNTMDPAKFTFVRRLGMGGFGVAMLFEMTDRDGTVYPMVVKANIRSGASHDNLYNEKLMHVAMAGAKHFVQRILLQHFPIPRRGQNFLTRMMGRMRLGGRRNSTAPVLLPGITPAQAPGPGGQAPANTPADTRDRTPTTAPGGPAVAPVQAVGNIPLADRPDLQNRPLPALPLDQSPYRSPVGSVLGSIHSAVSAVVQNVIPGSQAPARPDIAQGAGGGDPANFVSDTYVDSDDDDDDDVPTPRPRAANALARDRAGVPLTLAQQYAAQSPVAAAQARPSPPPQLGIIEAFNAGPRDRLGRRQSRRRSSSIRSTVASSIRSSIPSVFSMRSQRSAAAAARAEQERENRIREARRRIDERNDCIITEYMPRGDLHDWITRMVTERVVLSDRQLWLIFDCLFKACLAMAYPFGNVPLGKDPWSDYIPQQTETVPEGSALPSMPMVHFDLDPRNILVGDFDPTHDFTPVMKVADPGLSNFIDDSIRNDELELWWQRCAGKPTYYTPEMFTKEWDYVRNFQHLKDQETAGNYNWWSNLFGIGLCMQSLITHTYPEQPPRPWYYRYAADDKPAEEVRGYTYGSDMFEERGYLPTPLGRAVDPALLALVVRCLDHNPTKRPTMAVVQRRIQQNLATPWTGGDSDENMRAAAYGFWGDPKGLNTVPPPPASGPAGVRFNLS